MRQASAFIFNRRGLVSWSSSNSALLTFWAGRFLLGAIVCMVRCLAASLIYPLDASRISLPQPPKFGQPRLSPDIAKCPWEGKVTITHPPLPLRTIVLANASEGSSLPLTLCLFCPLRGTGCNCLEASPTYHLPSSCPIMVHFQSRDILCVP